MPLDPTTLLEEARCLECEIPPGAVPYQILAAIRGMGVCVITTSELPNGTDGTPYSQVITANVTATFAVTDGALPDGLTLHADGTIDGTPTLPNTFNFTVTATTASGTCSRDLSIIIIPNEPPVFEPPQLADLFLWVRPEELEGFAVNDPISTWVDQSPAGNDLTGGGGSAAASPTRQTDGGTGFAIAEFDGVDDFINNPASTFPAHTEYTAFIVLRHNSATGSNTALHVGVLNGYVLLKDTNNREIVHRGIAALVDGGATTALELWTARKTAVPLTELRVNGVDVAITNSGSSMTTPDGGVIALGIFTGVGLPMAGPIVEVLLYNIALSDVDRDTVEAHLLDKYSL